VDTQVASGDAAQAVDEELTDEQLELAAKLDTLNQEMSAKLAAVERSMDAKLDGILKILQDKTESNFA